jgi:predicted flap endonuclease-1-like 5' DNA nuclease
MKEGTGSKFAVGLIFGVLLGALVWYWQKSTSAEDGALALLDRLASAEARLRELKSKRVAATTSPGPSISSSTASKGVVAPEPADDLKAIKGIGPVFEKRLHDANVRSFDQLKHFGALELARILEVSDGRARSILAELSANT